MEIHPKDFCILIASHISNSERITLLIECLNSLIAQIMSITIYVSISFETENIMNEAFAKITEDQNIKSCAFLNILVRERKCSQMHHIEMLCKEIDTCHKWIMFCDDDDKYLKERTFKIGEQIVLHEKYIEEKEMDMKLGGIYESTFNKNHREHGHEYWCYCIHKNILVDFFNKLANKINIIDHPCCDVLLSEYLRRKNDNLYFGQIKEKLYWYREKDNNNSITHYITSQQDKYTNKSVPPSKDSNEWEEYISNFNTFVKTNKDIFMHDLFVLSITGIDFDAFLKREFLANYEILEYIDQQHIQLLKEKHRKFTTFFQSIYEIK